MPAAEVRHLREHFDHGCQADDGGLFGVEVYEAGAEARTVGQVAVRLGKVFLMAGGAVLEVRD